MGNLVFLTLSINVINSAHLYVLLNYVRIVFLLDLGFFWILMNY